MDKTIDMAREVKATAYTNRHYPDRTTYTFNPEQLKAFEALVRADEREQGQKWFDAVTAQHKQLILAEREVCANAAMVAAEEAVNLAMALEREACAKVVEESSLPDSYSEACLPEIAAAIRARGNT
jgi:hypothetical protein